MPTDENAGVERLEKAQEIITILKSTYPDAKKFSVRIRFEWQETKIYDDGAELCPVVDIAIER